MKKWYVVKDDAGNEQVPFGDDNMGNGMSLTDEQADDLRAQLPEGWSVEEAEPRLRGARR